MIKEEENCNIKKNENNNIFEEKEKSEINNKDCLESQIKNKSNRSIYIFKVTSKGRDKKNSKKIKDGRHTKYSKDNLYIKIIRFLLDSIIKDLKYINDNHKFNYFFHEIYYNQHKKDFGIKNLYKIFDLKIEDFITKFNKFNQNIYMHITQDKKGFFQAVFNMKIIEYYKDICMFKLKTSLKYQDDFNLLYYAEYTLLEIYDKQKKDRTENK